MKLRQRIETDLAPPSTGFRSQAMVAGGLLFTGGMIGMPYLTNGEEREPATLEEQVHLCLRHLEQVSLAGGAPATNVVEVSAFLVPPSAPAAVEEQIAGFLGHRPPLINTRMVEDVAMHGLLELDWIARVDNDLSQAQAAEWLKPLGHTPGLHGCGPFVALNGVHAAGATLEEQSYAVLREAAASLGAVGSGFDHLVKMTVYIAAFNDYPQFDGATRGVFGNLLPPTRSVVVAPAITGAALLRVDFLALQGG
jgi:2-iminobutanoate/2-iminopropanoate deaminase